MSKHIAHARVTVTLEIAVKDSWGDDCPISQVNAQAIDSALGLLRNLNLPAVKVIGEPNVTAVIVRKE